ncbi:DNA topoisomerase [Melia azedarach]|uniref:DNA topoisomerase n=1 Tax=Melia azedarach TaxID=155640 RepID=A0ACC1Z105_MELAZ|nr:DNA topoisomerase [Melia azedarach]
MQKGSCFNCHKQGHWARDCPSKTPKKSSSSSSARGGPISSPDQPVIHCPCGSGPCLVFVSRTEKNPDRKFYTCPVPGAGKCHFFKWYDKVTVNDINSFPGVVAPKCECGAGVCRRETEATGPNAGRSYFVCPIKKGLGACNFRLENTQVDTTVNESEDESKGYGSPQSTCDSHSIFDIVNSNMHKSNDLSLEQPGRPKFGLQKVDNPTDLPNSTSMSISSSQDGVQLTENRESGKTSDILSLNQHDSSPFVVPGNESSVLDSANGNLVVQVEKAAVDHLMCQSVIPCWQMQFWRQISAAVNISKRADVVHQSVGLHMLGWLGRLAFPPSRCLTNRPPAPFLCVIFPSFNPICIPQDRDMLYSEGSTMSRRLSNDELDKLSASISGQDLQLWNGDLRKASGVKRSSTTVEEIGTSKMLKFFEQTAFSVKQLLTIMSSVNPCDHHSLTRGVSEVFSVLNDMSVENNPVNGRLKEFADSALKFDRIEQSFGNERSIEELIELYNEQQIRFDDISKVHKKAVADFTASSKRLQSLHEEASRVREMLSQIENQLSCCEAETSNLKTHVDVISRDMLESKRSMQEAEEALKFRKQREEERCAAKAALEKARIQLHQ